jgi:hypothetical protein
VEEVEVSHLCNPRYINILVGQYEAIRDEALVSYVRVSCLKPGRRLMHERPGDPDLVYKTGTQV